jgi:hypothetical protein
VPLSGDPVFQFLNGGDGGEALFVEFDIEIVFDAGQQLDALQRGKAKVFGQPRRGREITAITTAACGHPAENAAHALLR